jgi:hypothetical protein
MVMVYSSQRCRASIRFLPFSVARASGSDVWTTRRWRRVLV